MRKISLSFIALILVSCGTAKADHHWTEPQNQLLGVDLVVGSYQAGVDFPCGSAQVFNNWRIEVFATIEARPSEHWRIRVDATRPDGKNDWYMLAEHQNAKPTGGDSDGGRQLPGLQMNAAQSGQLVIDRPGKWRFDAELRDEDGNLFIDTCSITKI